MKLFACGFSVLAIIIPFWSVTPATAGDADLAKKLSNPLAALISVPFQFNIESGFGSADGEQTTLNIQPVIPFSISENMSLITRTIIPYKWQDDISSSSGKNEGWGDTVMSFWFSPKDSANGITWGLGPVFNIPTSGDRALGVGEWGGGITGVFLKQKGSWTFGGLANHIWSFESSAMNVTYIQPFLSYTTPNAWTYTVNSESSYDWNSDQWTAPVNLMIAKLVSIGGQKVSLQAGAKYYLDSPASGPDDWGFRLAATFVFPK
jgi:hypothetical protein